MVYSHSDMLILLGELSFFVSKPENPYHMDGSLIFLFSCIYPQHRAANILKATHFFVLKYDFRLRYIVHIYT